MTLKEATKIKEVLELLIVDSEMSFGPAYEITKERKEKALQIIKREIRKLENE